MSLESYLEAVGDDREFFAIVSDGDCAVETLAVVDLDSLDDDRIKRLSAIQTEFEIPDEDLPKLVRWLLKAMCEHRAAFCHPNCWRDALFAARHFFTEDQELILLVLRTAFRLSADSVPEAKSLAWLLMPETDGNRQYTYQDIADYLFHEHLNAKVADRSELLQLWAEAALLRHRAGMNLCFLLGFLRHVTIDGVSVDTHPLVEIMMRERVLRELKTIARGNTLFSGEHLDTLYYYLSRVGSPWLEGDFLAVYEQTAVQTLSFGYLGRWSTVESIFGKTLGSRLSTRKIVREAIEQAKLRGEFGLASALAEHPPFADLRVANTNTREKLRAEAERRLQPVRLNYEVAALVRGS